MNSLVRNIFLFSLLLPVLFSVLTCGPSVQEKKIDTAFKNQTYKNMTAGVHYVGMMKCRQCNYDKYETFIETGMGKSFGRATKTKSSAKFDSHSLVHDKFSDFYYYPFWSDDTMKIMEFRLQGKDTTYQRIEKVDYIIGSGHHTNSHILNTNGYLYQMLMTFYTQEA